MTSRDDVIDQKFENIWNLWIIIFHFMYHRTVIVYLLLLKCPKTAICSGFSFMTSLDDVIDRKSKNIWNLWVNTFLMMYPTTIFVKLLLLKSPKTVKFSILFPLWRHIPNMFSYSKSLKSYLSFDVSYDYVRPPERDIEIRPKLWPLIMTS